jgi:crotonobetainyl-CoA:carnitine CoA-transferase CaiB-like acyl-CoA transferase
MPSLLDGLRVLDFSHALAGPYCTMLLAQYGADVYKIETPDGGEIGRTWGPPFTGDEASYFLGINAGKRSLSIDLKKPQGVALCLDLMEHVDVVIENMRPGTMERLGLGYSAARARNPKLIYCSVSGYGQNGPSRDDPAMDLILQAASGLISVTGVEGGEHVRCGHSVADITAGMFSIIGILLALQARNRTGQGQFVDVSMLDGMISAMASNFAYFIGSGIIPEAMGTRFATIVPYRGFPTTDKDIVIAVASAKLWEQFCDAMDRPEWASDPKYATNALRVENREALESEIAHIFKTNSSAYWTKRLLGKGIPCSPVRDLADVSADPQVAAREMLPVIDGIQVTGPPVKFPAAPGRIPRRAPKLGEHSVELLKEILKLDDARISTLIDAGVVHAIRAAAQETT